MLYFEAHNADWAVSVDGQYMNLAQEGSVLETEVSAEQGALQTTLYRRIAPAVEALVGGRVYLLGAGLEEAGR